MIDCREAVRRMWTYLDEALEAKPAEEFEAHLLTCQRCCGELEFNRQMRDVVAEREGTPPMPDELRSRIDLLLAGAEGMKGGAA
ncbi:MAG TPA: zf-HC2 domain-containing protein [Candidatus Limnocylindrales bacterium]|nr:zf-HC2 domain-containing protein [Candidatus Limnocylindrales bacterium]